MGVRSEKIQKVVLVILSILLAFFLWLYVMGEKNPIQNKDLMNVPVVLTNVDAITQANLVQIPDQTFNVDLTLSGRAFDLSKITTNDIKVIADMSIGLKKGTNNVPIKIIYPQSRISVIPKNKSSFITVKLDALAEKTVPVIINTVGNVKEGYGYTKPVSRPAEVLVSGPSNYVDSVFAASGSINISGNHTLISNSISVIPQDKNGVPVSHINLSPTYIDATVSIKPSKEVPIKIDTYGVVGSGKILKNIKPQLDRLVIIGDNKYLSRINEINTNALDLSKITNSITVQLPLNLPLGVASVDNVSDVKVDIILENKVEKTISYGITLKNKSQDYDYNLSTDYINATLSGPQSIMNTIDATSISPTIDVAKLTEGMQTMPVEVGQIDGIDIKSVTPADIQVDITKK